MKRLCIILVVFVGIIVTLKAQDSLNLNTADRLLRSNTKLSIGGYGEIHYNQGVDKNTSKNGNLDVHRMVMLFGYKFNKRTNFITEIEFEHVNEIYVEQAFLQYRINNSINFRAGLMLVPMGITNEFHEPTTFNGVERPFLDKYIVPTTWRENGLGFTGNLKSINLKYQVYVMNGFSGHKDGKATFNAGNGLRSGRQKGAESFMSSPTFSSKLDYYGIKGLKLGLAGYFGKSQTQFSDNINKNDEAKNLIADSSVVNIAMIGVNAIYTYKALQLRMQFNNVDIKNTQQYNQFFGSDLGANLMGYYGEISYDLFYTRAKWGSLMPFVRYEKYNTHNKVENGTTQLLSNNRSNITMGLGWKITKGSVLKADYQIFENDAAGSTKTNMLNFGVGVWF